MPADKARAIHLIVAIKAQKLSEARLAFLESWIAKEIREAYAEGFKRGLEMAARFEETTCLEEGELVQHTKDEASIEQQLKAEAIRALLEKPDE